jgi:hypothetical protein
MGESVKIILIEDERMPAFKPSDPFEALEKDFEKVVCKALAKLYPSAHVISFKTTLPSQGYKWKADLALVDKSWEYWFVIEVETADHHLRTHVLPQAIAFRDADYSTSISALSKGLGISLDKTKTLVARVPRYVAVISNHYDPTWDRALEEEQIQYMSITGFLHSNNANAHLVEGSLKIPKRNIGFGRVSGTVQGVRLFKNPKWVAGSHTIIEASGVSKWECILEQDEAWLLRHSGRVSLAPNTLVQFFRQDDGSILMDEVY